MSDLRFAEPAFVHGLWVVAVLLVGAFWLEGRGGRLLGAFVAPAMQARVVRRTPAWRRRARLVLIGTSLVGLVIALMRPQWGFEFVATRRVGAEIMIALDVSRSMLAEDVAPNRLERAKAEIRDLLPYLQGDQVGLIAFAGRASVLCPLTPDFGFLRLVLDNVDTRSVARGGTRLEEPIRKATAGFGTTGDLARVILLITDGEDHDSFPVEAAREAAERGIRILAIGFGDEAGSEIFVTDPRTGARRRVTDADGRPVVTRLDGALLRELALVTDGAYVPAGTGVLDLESIFETHIRPLMRAEGTEGGRTMRKDGFQWALLVAWLALIAAVALGAGRATALAAAIVVLAGGGALPARAQSDPGTPAPAGAPGTDPATTPAADPATDPPTDPATTGGEDGAEPGESRATRRLEIPEDPREAFNAGLAAFEADALDDAERLFEAARRAAGTDGEVRYRATYDLGWLDVSRADARLESDPEAALAALERAADWFREAVALRPEAEAPRRNLEIVLARALALADSLAQRDPETLEQKLEALIAAQRAQNAEARALVEALQASGDPNAADALRTRFEALAIEERTLLGDAGAAADLAGDELASLQALPDEEQTPESAMRAAQLEALLAHLHRARERMGQARSQLRRRQAERAHRRGAAGLERLKRAREQLQDPARILDGLVVDATELLTETHSLAGAGVAVGPDRADAPAVPDWLDAAYLHDVQTSVAERTAELDARLRGALDQAATVTDPEQRALLDDVAEAAPHLGRARDRFAEATEALALEDVGAGAEQQAEGLDALVRAREQLLDLRGLIEVSYGDQRRIHAVLSPPAGAAEEERGPLGEYAPALQALQARNLERAERITTLLEQARSRLEPEEATDDERAEATPAERERLDLADGLLALTESAMRGARTPLADLATDPAAAEPARERVAQAVRGLEALRRLFFTLVEHVRDTARRQVALGDETEAAGGLPEAERPDALAPLTERQSALGRTAGEIANALHEQALADPAELLGSESGADPAAAEQTAERLTRAAELVLEASGDMEAAAEDLAADAPGIDVVRGRQDEAVARLAEALALLEPPGADPQQGPQQPEQQAGQQPSPESETEPTESAERANDPGQILQAVRDREAERHRRRTRGSQGYEPVEKDW